MRTRVKICGITRSEDAMAAARLGADAVGLVFWSRSARAVTAAAARAAIRGLPPFVTVVGLFVDPPTSHVEAVLREVRLDLLQFHGDEPAALCETFGRPYVKAVRMREGTDLARCAAAHPWAAGLLLDSYVPGLPGGTGVAFDWSRAAQELDKPVILAGGLDADNVGVAIARVRPYAVDVSGGVEAAKGIKDPVKMAAFMRGVSHAE